jgi:hypothetical protein
MRQSSDKARYWFLAKRYGWGWGPPATWQGWLVMLCALAAIAAAVLRFLPSRPMAFLLAVLMVTGPLLIICYWNGEPPAWRWGESDHREPHDH